MLKNITKKIIPMLLLICLVMQVAPLAVLGAGIQEPVTKDGTKYADVITYTGNSSANLGDKITANGAVYDIMFNDEIVGSFTFNKNSPYIDIILTDDVAVSILWNCGSKYADCTLKGAGAYRIPQLLQDNGKTQSFDAIWVISIKPNDDSVPVRMTKTSANDKVTVTLDITLKKEQIATLSIHNVENHDLLNDAMPGYVCNAFELYVEGTFQSAILTFEFDPDFMSNLDFAPVIYYWNEQEYCLEELPNQIVDGNTVTITVNHFSKYIPVIKGLLDDFEVNIRPIFDKFVGDYEGRYYLYGGTVETGFSIKVYQEAWNYYAILKYYFPANNPTVVGIFKADVVYNFGKEQYELMPKEWLYHQLPEWYMVSFKGKLTDDGVFYKTEGELDFRVDKISVDYGKIAGWYQGTYTASQELMGANLIVEKDKSGEYAATFGYFSDPQSPNAKTGSYKMQIMYSPRYDEYSFVGDRWIEKSSPYGFVHLIGKVDGNSFKGYTASSGVIGKVGTFDFSKPVRPVNGGTVDEPNFPYYKIDGPKKGSFHGGIDFDVYNEPVFAAFDGTVLFAKEGKEEISWGGDNNYKNWDGGYGTCIIIESVINGETCQVLYAHLSKINDGISEGVRVFAGQPIGISGATGSGAMLNGVPQNHLHFEVRRSPYTSPVNDNFRPTKADPNNIVDVRYMFI